jgi:hypothetical protein
MRVVSSCHDFMIACAPSRQRRQVMFQACAEIRSEAIVVEQRIVDVEQEHEVDCA